jgi:hypothetical protein
MFGADRGCRGGARVGRAGRAGSRPNAIDEAREEVDAMLAQRGDELARPLQRAPRPHVRALRLEVRPDIAGYADLTHAFDLAHAFDLHALRGAGAGVAIGSL